MFSNEFRKIDRISYIISQLPGSKYLKLLHPWQWKQRAVSGHQKLHTFSMVR